MWRKFDLLLTRWEKSGFNRANKLHIYTVNTILAIVAFQGFLFFRDYNLYFLEARLKEEDKNMIDLGPSQQSEYPLNKNLKVVRGNRAD